MQTSSMIRKAGRFLPGVAAFCAFAWARPAAAAPVSAASVDQILSALAEVVKDRAKVVATETLQRNVVSEVCSGTLELKRKDDEAGVLTLYMGGSDACKKAPSSACTVDDQFVDSCKLLETLKAPITDPTLLKRFTRDALRFGFRIAGAQYTAERYTELNIADLSDFVFDLLDLLSHSDATVADLPEPLLRFADRLSEGRAVSAVQGIGASRELGLVLDRINSIKAAVQKELAGGAGGDVLANDQNWLPATPDKASCNASSSVYQPAAGAKFRELFTQTGAKFESAHLKGCAAVATASAADLQKCHAAMIATRLYPPLAKAKCAPFSPDIARDRRNLYYLFSKGADRATVDAALAAFVKEPDPAKKAKDEVDALYAAARDQLVNDAGVGQYEIAAALRLVARLIQAYDVAPKKMDTWLDQLRQDLEAQIVEKGDIDPSKLPALMWQNRGDLAPSIQAVRDSAEDLFAMPRMRFAFAKAPNVTAVQAGARSIVTAIRDLFKIANEHAQGSKRSDAINQFARVLAAQASILHAIADIESDPTKKLAMNQLVAVLGQASTVSRAVAAQDWVSIGVTIADNAQEQLKDQSDLADVSRSLAFARVLLGAYQAKTKEDAKAVFEGALEDVVSRERRYYQTAVDIGALVGAGGGYMRRDAENLGMYALYAPFGIQVTSDWFGALAYPVDIGAYLMATGSDPKPPEASEALRAGAALFIRPCPSIPIVFGAGGDFHPKLQDAPPAWRVTGFLGLELPLYMIH